MKPSDAMRESREARPILFTVEMVRAILDGRKSQTRRVIKPQPLSGLIYSEGFNYAFETKLDAQTGKRFKYDCPYGVPGGQLWVRERWQHFGNFYQGGGTSALVKYADGKSVSVQVDNPPARKWWNTGKYPFAPSIHMPRWASRITLEITEVRVQRLQEITGEDAEAEGVGPVFERDSIRHASHSKLDAAIYRDQFAKLWDSLNAKRGFGWVVNPWVWAISFRQIPEKPKQVEA